MGPHDVLQAVHDREPILDQWQAQTLAAILERVEVGVYSSMARADIEACKLAAVDDLNAALRERVLAIGRRRAGGGAAGRPADHPVSGVNT